MIFSFRNSKLVNDLSQLPKISDHLICFEDITNDIKTVKLEHGRCIFNIIRALLKMKQTVLILKTVSDDLLEIDTKKRISISPNSIFLNVNSIYFFKSQPALKLDSFSRLKKHLENFDTP